MNENDVKDLFLILRDVQNRLTAIEHAIVVRPVKYDSPLLTVEEAAKEYRVSKATLYKWQDTHVKIGRLVRISRQLLEKRMNRPEFIPTPPRPLKVQLERQ